jgi:hypothetical protein
MKDEALRLALEALEAITKSNQSDHQAEIAEDAITAIKAALEEKDEPVAWRAWVSKFPQGTGSDWVYVTKPIMKDSIHNQPLYTTPPQRTWVGLTNEEIHESKPPLSNDAVVWELAVEWAEAKLKEKNT